jgi:hypothetical protein
LEIEKIPKYRFLEFIVKHHIFAFPKKFSKVISKPKPKVENDLEIQKNPKISHFGIFD